jgi:hypothetical protein
MMKVKLDVGAEIDTLNKDELQEALKKDRALAEEQERVRLSGVKYMRMPRLYATPASGTVVMGEAWTANGTVQPYTGQSAGPNSGYAWAIRRLAVNGLGTGSSPDLLNIYRNGKSTDPIWQLNGNSYAYTFGKGEMVLLPGEKLIAASTGSMTATNSITLNGDIIEVPSEMLAKVVS